MIYLEKLRLEEKKAIKELQNRLEDDLPKHIYEDTILLYKFLKARDFDMNKAENMLRKHITWRKHFQVDSILEDFTPRPFFQELISHLGLDKNGDIILYSPSGKLETNEVMKCFQANEYRRHWIWYFEAIVVHAKKLVKKPGTSKQITLILNLDKLTLANATSKTSVEEFVQLTHLLQDNFPESLNAVYLINSPGYYIFIYSILKTIMSSALIQKVHVYGHSGWSEKLLEVIDADVLPAFLGGNRRDPDGNPSCTTFVTQGGKIPEKYYLSEEERNFKNKSLVKRLTISAKQKKEICVNVKDAGSRIHWEFLIKTRDIGFGIFYENPKGEFSEILPVIRYDTVDGVERGSYKAQSNGNYIIVFDNSYSWIFSKEVDYCITVLNPVS